MTHAQKKVLDAISAFVTVHGYSPTMRQIADASGLKSISTAHKHVQHLRRAGALLPNPKRGSAGRITPVYEPSRVGSQCAECARLKEELKCARRLLEEVRH